MRCVEADPERDLRAHLHEQREMLETVADVIALSGAVFSSRSERAKLQSFAGDFQTLSAERDAIRLCTPANFRMHDDADDNARSILLRNDSRDFCRNTLSTAVRSRDSCSE